MPSASSATQNELVATLQNVQDRLSQVAAADVLVNLVLAQAPNQDATVRVRPYLLAHSTTYSIAPFNYLSGEDNPGATGITPGVGPEYHTWAVTTATLGASTGGVTFEHTAENTPLLPGQGEEEMLRINVLRTHLVEPDTQTTVTYKFTSPRGVA